MFSIKSRVLLFALAASPQAGVFAVDSAVVSCPFRLAHVKKQVFRSSKSARGLQSQAMTGHDMTIDISLLDIHSTTFLGQIRVSDRRLNIIAARRLVALFQRQEFWKAGLERLISRPRDVVCLSELSRQARETGWTEVDHIRKSTLEQHCSYCVLRGDGQGLWRRSRS